jgi:hypothetical protein
MLIDMEISVVIERSIKMGLTCNVFNSYQWLNESVFGHME